MAGSAVHPRRETVARLFALRCQRTPKCSRRITLASGSYPLGTSGNPCGCAGERNGPLALLSDRDLIVLRPGNAHRRRTGRERGQRPADMPETSLRSLEYEVWTECVKEKRNSNFRFFFFFRKGETRRENCSRLMHDATCRREFVFSYEWARADFCESRCTRETACTFTPQISQLCRCEDEECLVHTLLIYELDNAAIALANYPTRLTFQNLSNEQKAKDNVSVNIEGS